MHREVNLTKRIRTSTGLRYCPVVLSANGRQTRRGAGQWQT
jgi:hypothetical protein